MKQNCSAKNRILRPPPGMAYKIQSGNGSVYYLGSCPEGKARAFCKAKKGITLEAWKSKGWLSLGVESPEEYDKRKKLSKNTKE